ncbi:hypothetical protein LTR85_011353 [Meristemomyces frigidus]|nr:hypothetical protein LTR85_011353 [Meristemomyces frigidus]
MSGTTESSAGTHSTRQPSGQEQKLIDDILLLYQAKPTHESYSHYAEDAVFHDPVSLARGKESIMSQFNGMPKIFAESTTEHYALLSDSTPQEIKLNLTQNYVFKSPIPFKSKGTEKPVNSKITLRLNESGKIVEHIEEWDHEGNKTADDGFAGKLQEGRKKFGAKVVEKSVSSNPSDVNPDA